MNAQLLDRLAVLILWGDPFTSDEVTLRGSVTAAGDHAPNASQNSIGSLFQSASRQGWIAFTGETRRSAAPHRKGGLIRVWQGTDKGVKWAETRRLTWPSS